jgi:hypothetical protein
MYRRLLNRVGVRAVMYGLSGIPLGVMILRPLLTTA